MDRQVEKRRREDFNIQRENSGKDVKRARKYIGVNFGVENRNRYDTANDVEDP